MAENLAQFLGDVSPIGGGPAARDDCGGSELSFRPDARGADASSRPPLGQRVEVSSRARVVASLPFAPRAVRLSATPGVVRRSRPPTRSRLSRPRV
jgi:hypothetical protein